MSGRVLVVDDDPEMRALVRRSLDLGMPAKSGDEVLEHARAIAEADRLGRLINLQE